MSSISHIIHAHVRDIGFPVRRLLPAAEVRTVGPFVFFDHMGPFTFPSEGSTGDVRPHPHIGLATVTYLFPAQWYTAIAWEVSNVSPRAILTG